MYFDSSKIATVEFLVDDCHDDVIGHPQPVPNIKVDQIHSKVPRSPADVTPGMETVHS